MSRAVRLLDVDHRKICAGNSIHGPQRDARLVIHKRPYLILIHGLEFEIREGAESRTEPFRYPKVRLGRPEPDVSVDVVDIRKDWEISRNEVCRIAGNVNRCEISVELTDIEGEPRLRAASLEIEQPRLP